MATEQRRGTLRRQIGGALGVWWNWPTLRIRTKPNELENSIGIKSNVTSILTTHNNNLYVRWYWQDLMKILLECGFALPIDVLNTKPTRLFVSCTRFIVHASEVVPIVVIQGTRRSARKRGRRRGRKRRRRLRPNILTPVHHNRPQVEAWWCWSCVCFGLVVSVGIHHDIRFVVLCMCPSFLSNADKVQAMNL